MMSLRLLTENWPIISLVITDTDRGVSFSERSIPKMLSESLVVIAPMSPMAEPSVINASSFTIDSCAIPSLARRPKAAAVAVQFRIFRVILMFSLFIVCGIVYNDASRQRASAADKRRPIHEKIGYDGQCSSFRS